MAARKPISSSKSRRTKVMPKAQAKALPQNAFAALLPTVQTEVEIRLRGFLETRLDIARRHGPEVLEMVSAVRDLCLRGGKRFRPALLAAGYRATDEKAALEPALDAGVALELLQAYLLIHDDWMDGDLVRRGGPAVHAQLAKRFRSQHKGEASGVLAGDYASAVALEALSQVEMRRAAAPAAMACFAEMQLDAIAGQQLDVIGGEYDVELAYQLKTGSYTVRGPLRLGAILAAASPSTLRTLDRFALPVGVAFQLRDDLLSAFGEPKQTGKPLGNDLRAGKRTALLVAGLKLARGKELRALRHAVGNRSASEREVRTALGVLESTGARAAIEARVDELSAAGLRALKTGVTRQGALLLAGAAEALTTRRS
ncbi:MAG TPA: polyprenyl synthetase family protein [Polyangiaceae bacterium]|jgi:geranylgeranyl diphosphate synthase type I|nr:polyprenyl synthetase family protein [Polyangiaceae bacterium]